jgi:hypothetical protein
MREPLQKVYSIQSGCSRGFAYAYDCGPFDGFGGLNSISPLLIERKKRIWEESGRLPGLAIDDHGNKWPDVLRCENPPPSDFFSRKVVDSLLQHEVRVREVLPVVVGSILNEKLAADPLPTYYFIEPEPGISIDFGASGIELDSAGKPRLKVGQPVIAHLDPATWSGYDLFMCRNWPHGGKALYCTERIKRIAEDDDWTNVEFLRQRVIGVDPFSAS